MISGLLGIGTELYAQAKGNEVFSPFVGSFGQAIPIAVPGYRGLEPKLVLSYSSEASYGLLGVGWMLSGFSTIQRASPGRGSPKYDANDIYLLDGQEVVPCGPQVTGTSASCSASGTHTTKNETFLRVQKDVPAAGSWTVTGRDGTKSVFTPVYVVGGNTYRLGLDSMTDTNNNTVDYTWACVDGDCYPDSVSYLDYSIKLYREARDDKRSFATGLATALGRTDYRLRSILVKHGSSPISAYKLTYTYSPANGQSRLMSIQRFGRDVAIDSAGVITAGTSLPAQTFAYQADAQAKSFQCFGSVPCPGPTPTPSPSPSPTPTPPPNPTPPCYATYNACVAACPVTGVCERKIECGGPTPAQAHKCFP
jgi:hypothetical protein